MVRQILGPNKEIWATAPDESWFTREVDGFPELNVLVEICYSSRNKVPAKYSYFIAKVTILPRHEREGATWLTESDQELIFNPDFWRPLK